MTSKAIALFEHLATQAEYKISSTVIAFPNHAMQQAFEQNNSHLLKQQFCNPEKLANKTTIFQL